MYLYEEKIVCGKKGLWFDVKKYKLTSLPKNFKCDASLNCDGSSLIELPDGLYVKGDLYIGDADIVELPHNLIVCGDLILLNSQICDLPDDICVGKNIISLQTNNIPHYEKNTKYKNFICDNNKEIIPFKYEKEIKRQDENLGYLPRETIYFYYGYDSTMNAARRASKKEYFKCGSFREAIEKIEREILKESPIYQKYLNYDINEKRFVKELVTIFQEITNACESGIKKFFNETNLIVKENKYTIKELCNILKQDYNSSTYPYTFLFLDYFLHREKF